MNNGFRNILVAVFFSLGLVSLTILVVRLTIINPSQQLSKEAMNSGRKSAINGVSAEANPYVGQSERAAWLKGWVEGKQIRGD